MRHILLICATLLLSISVISAQIEGCMGYVEEALNIADAACDRIGRNQVCYGNSALEAGGTDDFHLDTVGDIGNVEQMQWLNPSAYDEANNEWGIALFTIQANIPDTLPGQNVTIIAFGNTQIINEVEPGNTAILSASQGANVRTYPSATNSVVIGSIIAGDEVTATGQYTNNDGERWLRVKNDNSTSGTGWVIDWLLTGEGIDSLPSVGADSINLNPMQAFALRTGIGQLSCNEAPLDGMMIQTPPGTGRITLTINGIKFSIGSTVFFTIAEDKDSQYLLAATLQGRATVTIDDVTQGVGAGQATLIPIDNDVPAGLAQAPRSIPDVFASADVPFSREFFSLLLGLTPDSDLTLSFESQTVITESGEEINIPADVIVLLEGAQWHVIDPGYGDWPGPYTITNILPGISFTLDTMRSGGPGAIQGHIWNFTAVPENPNTYIGYRVWSGGSSTATATIISPTQITGFIAFSTTSTIYNFELNYRG